MFAMVNIMGIDHSLQIPASLSRAPGNPLMHNNVVKDKIKKSIAKDPDSD
jgi:hypothetical protein